MCQGSRRGQCPNAASLQAGASGLSCGLTGDDCLNGSPCSSLSRSCPLVGPYAGPETRSMSSVETVHTWLSCPRGRSDAARCTGTIAKRSGAGPNFPRARVHQTSCPSLSFPNTVSAWQPTTRELIGRANKLSSTMFQGQHMTTAARSIFVVFIYQRRERSLPS